MKPPPCLKACSSAPGFEEEAPPLLHPAQGHAEVDPEIGPEAFAQALNGGQGLLRDLSDVHRRMMEAAKDLSPDEAATIVAFLEKMRDAVESVD